MNNTSEKCCRTPLPCLLRYDTESADAALMRGFLGKVIEVHRRDNIPVTLFCCGQALEAREGEFREFVRETENDPLFEIADHSHTHVGVGYDAGRPVAELKADYERSFAAHERVCGRLPLGISICGTSGKDGKRLPFDASAKGRAELDMLVGLGVRMLNTHLGGRVESGEFCNYAACGHPEVMGFPSANSDTGWLCQNGPEKGLAAILEIIRQQAARQLPLAVIMHDWAEWSRAGDKELSLVSRLAAAARAAGYELCTHGACYARPELWRHQP